MDVEDMGVEDTGVRNTDARNMDLSNDGVFILTGATGGLAESVGEVFHEAGARLVVTARDGAALRARAARWKALPVEADLGSMESAAQVASEAIRAHGRIDGLLHLAGGFEMSPADETGIGEYERMMDVNMRTLFCAVRAVLPSMKAQGAGFIAGISAGLVRSGGGAGVTTYAAAKGALTAYLRALGAEARPHGIRVAVLFPMGTIDTPATRAAMPGQDRSSWIDPAEIGRALLFASTTGARGDIAEIALGTRGGA